MTGREAVGSLNPELQNRLLKLVKSSGAVSPATRARLSSMPVAIPRIAAGTTTVAMARHFFAPRASAPSRSDCGTARRNSSVLRRTMGTSMTARARPPASAEKWCMGRTTTV